jgi:hypothetical protein
MTAPTRQVVELTPDELELERYLLNLALQPLDSFDGFTQIEQYGLSALRYQLSYLQYALAMVQYTRTPAFTGYLVEAQSNAIEKMRDKRVWSYWSHENLIGYQRWNPDPIVYHNVMYTGFFAAMLGLFESLNDGRFSEPGALRLVWDDKHIFEYEFASVAEAIRRNMETSKHVMYPCEPRLIYPMCNAFAISGLLMHDRLHGSELTGDLVQRMRESLFANRYLGQDGRFVSCRGPLRFALPPAVGNDAILSYWLHAAMPDISERTWGVIREKFLTIAEDDAKLRTELFDGLDPGNYARGDAMTRAVVVATANEMGDTEAALAVERTLDERYEIVRQDGARRYRGLSTLANAAFALARFTREHSARDLILGQVPTEWQTGPVLAEAPYPDVLVAKALSDGRALELVLVAGDGHRRTTLRLGRLEPQRQYAVSGAMTPELTTDPDGCALLDVDLRDRTEVTVAPL